MSFEPLEYLPHILAEADRLPIALQAVAHGSHDLRDRDVADGMSRGHLPRVGPSTVFVKVILYR